MKKCMRVSKKVILVGSCLALLMSAKISLASAWCRGIPSFVFVGTDGMLAAVPPDRGDFVQFCNVRETWKGVSPQVCMLWFAVLSSAAKDKKSVTISYNDAQINDGYCKTIPTYGAAPAPWYVMMN